MSKSVDLKSATGIQAEIASIGKAGATLAKRVQACAVASLAHMIEHKDHTLLVNLHNALSKGMRRSALAAWILQFSALEANLDAAGKLVDKDKPFRLNKEKRSNLKAATETIWHTCGKADPTVADVYDVQKAFRGMLVKAMNANSMKGADRAKLVEAAAIFGIPESDVPTKTVTA